MTRKKVKLAFIANDSARKATFKKRKKGLMKKVSELSTLCGIDACAIVYSPYDPQPEVWPSPMGVQRVLSKFRRMPELEQSKKMVNQESFLRQRILKAKDQLKKQRKDNREKEMTQLMFQYLSAGKIMHNISMVDLNDLAWLIDQNLKDINRRIEVLTKNNGQSQTQVAPPVVTDVVAKIEDKAQGSSIHHGQGFDINMDLMHKQNWFMNLMNSGGGGGNEAMPFGDVNNHQNGFWPNPFFH
ncbi:agamous-like MADS-box protein AGL80 [Cajanus cajan]|uniref:Agamous-like MADS-box protein AGL80 n=1 Tax=Cajanus cajan TaxID=3821 RepID=A0A151U9H4_CAJCA|nr:agamous-like MADS-box protein AGL80 [Cajanus cajan]KYP75975.1 Agamous-like MADS-box protein AGL80 [Cajanus cajan]